jgi:preprotein translocase subunit SecY
MAIAIPIETAKRKPSPSWQPRLKGLALLKRLWWHTYAYLTILAILTLTLGSLLILYLHELYSQQQKLGIKARQ